MKIELTLDAKKQRFQPVYLLKPSFRVVQYLVSRGSLKNCDPASFVYGICMVSWMPGRRRMTSTDAPPLRALDLLHTGLRGPDAAAALRDGEGFCRP